LQDIFDSIAKSAPTRSLTDNAKSEQPFVTQPVWAYFSALQSIASSAVILAKVFAVGLEDPLKMINQDHIRGLLKAALPNSAVFIDENDINALYCLFDPIEDLLLGEIKKMLDGVLVDQEGALRAAQILKMTKALQSDREKSDLTESTRSPPGG
jgi:hypothetical protein